MRRNLSACARLGPSVDALRVKGCWGYTAVLTVVLPRKAVDRLLEVTTTDVIVIDLERQSVTTPFHDRFVFEIDPHRKQCLLDGSDEISLALAERSLIAAYEQKTECDLVGLWETRNVTGHP